MGSLLSRPKKPHFKASGSTMRNSEALRRRISLNKETLDRVLQQLGHPTTQQPAQKPTATTAATTTAATLQAQIQADQAQRAHIERYREHTLRILESRDDDAPPPPPARRAAGRRLPSIIVRRRIERGAVAQMAGGRILEIFQSSDLALGQGWIFTDSRDPKVQTSRHDRMDQPRHLPPQ
ncbi:hypothetical protein B0I37DRAFT_430930 [Chaetomium sp. MPI-CAGE-AT-0009]|nr:hypothetical protein B0I37DRAFT_430930 [Chaetomium sp. MPI-CAGE-AT-0009]